MTIEKHNTQERQKFAIIHNEQTPAVPEMDIKELLTHREVLVDFLHHASTSYSTGIGLAANQVRFADVMGSGVAGNRVMLPFFAKKTIGTDQWVLILNPKIISTSGDKLKQIEYCLTWPGQEIEVERHYTITVEYYDINGKKHTRTVSAFEAQLWQHEIDHLNGVEETIVKGSGGIRKGVKIMPNEPCPCGSGKKFKKCCRNK